MQCKAVQWFLSALFVLVQKVNAESLDSFGARLYKKLEFNADERAKVLLLDAQMQVVQVLSVKKGQKELKVNLQDSDALYVTFIENKSQAEEPLRDSKEVVQVQNVESQSLEDGIAHANFADSFYAERFERNRFFGGFLGFEPYKFNYILPANVSLQNEKRHAKRMEVKFQISLKKLLFDDLFFKDLDLYFAYTQQSFWQLYNHANSSPFRESNYEPMLYFSYPLESYNVFFDRVNFGYIHQSNGGDLDKSRSWDRLFIEGLYAYKDFTLGLRAWHRLKENPLKDDNPDILDYMGYGELIAAYRWNKHLWTLTLRNNLESKKGAILLDYSYPLHKSLYFYVQYFSGYGESLIDYRQLINRVGIGFLFTR